MQKFLGRLLHQADQTYRDLLASPPPLLALRMLPPVRRMWSKRTTTVLLPSVQDNPDSELASALAKQSQAAVHVMYPSLLATRPQIDRKTKLRLLRSSGCPKCAMSRSMSYRCVRLSWVVKGSR